MAEFVLTDETKVVEGVTVHRVKYTRKNRLVARNGLGGWVEKAENLQGGLVVDQAVVMGDAVLRDSSTAKDQAIVKDNAVLGGGATAGGKSVVSENAVVRGTNTIVGGYAQVYENAEVISGSLDGQAQVGGNAVVSDNPHLWGDVLVAGTVKLNYRRAKEHGSHFIERGVIINEEDPIPARRPVYRMSKKAKDSLSFGALRKQAEELGRAKALPLSVSLYKAQTIFKKYVELEEMLVWVESGERYMPMNLGIVDHDVSEVLSEDDILKVLRLGFSVAKDEDEDEPGSETTVIKAFSLNPWW